MPPRFRRFRFWCQSVLPLVYDDSLSYYEILCKVVNYLNDMVDALNDMPEEFDELKKELDEIKAWIDNFDTSYLEKVIEEYIATMVFFGLTDDGYFVVYIPDNWDSINFATTGYDTVIPLQPEYGHLVLLY